ncbi:hypothetical protein SAMN02982922_0610 [Mesorhizobium australicum]|uniref:Uncharacterized protein n=1 Tax=Mesorhizobium australicum TaxID=536018 RepID=A0A1X7MUT3_9HYPH|nr:hypothetical protein SAMN02982922_0610 [Mesorhizobium australicum]
MNEAKRDNIGVIPIGNITAFEPDFARSRGYEARNNPVQRGLANAIRAKHGNRFALSHEKVDSVQNREIAVSCLHPFDLKHV